MTEYLLDHFISGLGRSKFDDISVKFKRELDIEITFEIIMYLLVLTTVFLFYSWLCKAASPVNKKTILLEGTSRSQRVASKT